MPILLMFFVACSREAGLGNHILSIAVGCVKKLKHFHLGISSRFLLLRGPTKRTLSLYGIDLRYV